MQKKDGKWFTRKKGAMLVLTLCLVGAAAATTYYAVDLSDTAQEPAKEHMVDLNESPVETEAEAVISSEAEANLASQANEMDVDPESLAGGNRQIRAEQETAGQETEWRPKKFPPDRSTQWSVRRSALRPHRNFSGR